MSTTRRHHPTEAPGTTTMRAVVQEQYGPTPQDVLRQGRIARPTIGPAEVLVRVHAAAVDRGTWHLMAGLPYPVRAAGFGMRRPKATNPGRSLAGTVVAVGADVTEFGAGDEVFGVGVAAYAEMACARADRLAKKPANLTFTQAAAVPDSGLTALQAVRIHAKVVSGERVLVLGAAGGVGSFAVQLAVAEGAQVTGVSRTEKVDLVHRLGAHRVIDYTREDPTGDGTRYDVIIDTGGNRRLAHLRRALTPRGRLVIVGGENGGRWLGGTDRQLRAQLLSPFLRQQLGSFIASEDAAGLVEIRKLIEAGAIIPAIDRTFPLDRAAEAVQHLLDGRAQGKVVITP
ncbi:NAD(P)-dependent alcohol dehydrogenase [Actinoplanes sp. NPDC051346]|uniref:NAD(P)-dependent alcohol dehydrogenase n=1 Tax=Actinoplanes sp. NPDC051346 TaxID=3155048 RepID=UPI0034283941